MIHDTVTPIDCVPKLLPMRLTAFRRNDQVHIENMLQFDLITADVRSAIPSSLLPKLDEIQRGQGADM